jgi:hypothetical protein
VNPTSELACGDKGSVCRACTSGNVCRAGACVAGNGLGGGSGSGGTGGGNGGTGGGMSSGGSGGGTPTGSTDCSEEAKLVYLVSSDRTFSSFNPKLLPAAKAITDLGTLNCNSGGSPFSMSVDRDAVAWVLYQNDPGTPSELFRVEIRNSLKCTKVDFKAPEQFTVFGMGFVSDAPGSSAEKLYIAGVPEVAPGNNSKLGILSTSAPYGISEVGDTVGSPELTGTGDAKLWAFSPDSKPPVVNQLDKQTGKPSKTFEAASLQGNPRAWAFAFWGGDFFVFLQRERERSTTVHRVKGADGALSTALADIGRTVVGAGVSTCAPVDIN